MPENSFHEREEPWHLNTYLLHTTMSAHQVLPGQNSWIDREGRVHVLHEDPHGHIQFPPLYTTSEKLECGRHNQGTEGINHQAERQQRRRSKIVILQSAGHTSSISRSHGKRMRWTSQAGMRFQATCSALTLYSGIAQRLPRLGQRFGPCLPRWGRTDASNCHRY